MMCVCVGVNQKNFMALRKIWEYKMKKSAQENVLMSTTIYARPETKQTNSLGKDDPSLPVESSHSPKGAAASSRKT